MFHTYLWTLINIILMLIFWTTYRKQMVKDEKKRGKTIVKVSLTGGVLFTIGSLAGIGLSVQEFRNPYAP